MSDRAGLLAAVHAAPKDDAPRLVLADWLAGHKCALGEAIARDCTMFTLCRWYHELNGFRWPDDFPHPKPEGWDETTSREKYERGLGQPMYASPSTLVGQRNSLIYNNQIAMSLLDDDEFEDFWLGVFNGDAAALERYRRASWARAGGTGDPPGYGSATVDMDGLTTTMHNTTYRAFRPGPTLQEKRIRDMLVNETGYTQHWALGWWEGNGEICVNENYTVSSRSHGTSDTRILCLGGSRYRMNGRDFPGTERTTNLTFRQRLTRIFTPVRQSSSGSE